MSELPRNPQPGDRIGHATVLKVTRSKLPAGKRAKGAPDEPCGRVVTVSKNRVVLALTIPPRVLWPNGRPHWSVKSKAVKAHKACAANIAASAASVVGGVPWERSKLSVAWYWPDLRRRDHDGASASLKSYIDGLVVGGLLVDDSTQNLSYGETAFDVDRENPRVELTICRA